MALKVCFGIVILVMITSYTMQVYGINNQIAVESKWLQIIKLVALVWVCVSIGIEIILDPLQ